MTSQDQSIAMRAGAHQVCQVLADAETKLNQSFREVDALTSEQGQVLDSLGSNVNRSGLVNLLDNMLGEYIAEVYSSIEQVTTTAREISDTVRQFAGAMGAVASTAREIEAIGHQTRLVALNAATTAERAGEQGRAFGVIAQQVTELPLQASLLSSEIREVIASAERRLVSAVEQQDKAVDESTREATVAREQIETKRAGLQREAEHIRESLQAIGRARREIEQRVRENAEPLRVMRERRQALLGLADRTSF